MKKYKYPSTRPISPVGSAPIVLRKKSKKFEPVNFKKFKILAKNFASVFDKDSWRKQDVNMR